MRTLKIKARCLVISLELSTTDQTQTHLVLLIVQPRKIKLSCYIHESSSHRKWVFLTLDMLLIIGTLGLRGLMIGLAYRLDFTDTDITDIGLFFPSYSWIILVLPIWAYIGRYWISPDTDMPTIVTQSTSPHDTCVGLVLVSYGHVGQPSRLITNVFCRFSNGYA